MPSDFSSDFDDYAIISSHSERCNEIDLSECCEGRAALAVPPSAKGSFCDKIRCSNYAGVADVGGVFSCAVDRGF